MKNLKNIIKNQEGVALYLSVIVLIAVLAIGLGLSTILYGEIESAREIGMFIPVIYGGDAGIERSLYQIRDQGNFGSCPDPGCTVTSTVMDNGVSYRGIILDGGEAWCSATTKCIRSIGTIGETNRALEVSW